MKAVLFDLDDTLHDKSRTLRLVAEFQYASFSLRKQGVDLPRWIDAYVQHHNQLISKPQAFDNLVGEFQLDPAATESLVKEYNRECGKHAQPFPGAIDLLKACTQRGILIGCVTNGRDGHQRSKITGMGMEASFRSIVTSGAHGAKKPDLSIFSECVGELAVAASNCVFVGDNYQADMVPALKLGMRAVWKSSQHSPEVELCSDSLFEIRAHLFG